MHSGNIAVSRLHTSGPLTSHDFKTQLNTGHRRSRSNLGAGNLLPRQTFTELTSLTFNVPKCKMGA